MTPALILPFANVDPIFAGPLAFAEPRSAVIGRATIGSGAWLGEDSVIRADGEVVRIGNGVYLGHRATVHIVHELLPAIIGDNVTVGANSIVHACTVGDNCVIENDVTLLDDAKIAANVLIEACSTVFPRKVLDTGWIYAGSPAKPVRELKVGELAARAEVVRGRRGGEREMSPAVQDFGKDVFIAQTAQRHGRLSFSPGSSLFFSCVADAGTGSIFVGENTNVQDNTTIRVGAGDTTIGRNVTVGHNVAMGAVRVGEHTLIGMGAHLADGVLGAG